MTPDLLFEFIMKAGLALMLLVIILAQFIDFD